MLPLSLLGLAAVPADVVDSLPGYGAPPSKHYSGYLPVGNLSHSPGLLHYWLQESENDPANDPTVLWLNGGPGASGIIGMLTELGQLQTIPSPGASTTSADSTTAKPTPLYHNLYGWTKVANLLTIEQPKGVGFSYCTGSARCVNDDLTTAQDTYEALLSFFEKFPELKKNSFFIVGESCMLRWGSTPGPAQQSGLPLTRPRPLPKQMRESTFQ